VLAGCAKHTQVTIINKNLYKVTSYFVKTLKNLKLAKIEPARMFDWQIIYIDVSTRQSTRSLNIAITERDVIQMVHEVC
jgi:hypothetical protein